MGRSAHPHATSLLITADAGGSNGPRVRLWKWELQQFANRTGLSITVCHFPPGTSKWNKIEHRLFSHIAMNWRGKPLVSLVAIVSLIGSTTTAAGLRVRSELDRGKYPMGVVVTDQQSARIKLAPTPFTATGITRFVPSPGDAHNSLITLRAFRVRCEINAGRVQYDATMRMEEMSDNVIDVAGHMQKYAGPDTIFVATDLVRGRKYRDFTPADKEVDGFAVSVWRGPSADPTALETENAATG